jgi:hypothetical protein
MPGDRREVEAVKAEMLAALNDLRKLRGEEPLSRLPEAPFCSFCGKGKDEVNGMIEGLNAFICSECIFDAQRLLRATPK